MTRSKRIVRLAALALGLALLLGAAALAANETTQILTLMERCWRI